MKFLSLELMGKHGNGLVTRTRPNFLGVKSKVATKEKLQVAQDLLDTLVVHKERCVGMAANMIGVKKRIIAFLDESR